MSDAEDLDQALRAKLRDAAELEAPVAPSEARLSALGEALSRESVRARQRNKRLSFSALGVAAAAALALLAWPKLDARTTQPVASVAQLCSLPTTLSIAAGDGEKQRLALGHFGELVATPDARLVIERAEPCLLALRLERGTLAGDLSQLKPAVLRVRTQHGTVIVRGTRFSVRADDSLEVVLLSGRVDIEEEEKRTLEPQHVFRKFGKQRELSAARPEQARGVIDLLSRAPYRQPEAAAQTAAPDLAPDAAQRTEPRAGAGALGSASALLAQAESERRRGHLEAARALYAQASALRDDDAEVALLRWVRLELTAKQLPKAALLLDRHRQRFSTGKLRAEAAFLKVILLRDGGEDAKARAAAKAFIAEFPNAPQADGARELLGRP
jgi:FecR protein